jgi:amino acid transporter
MATEAGAAGTVPAPAAGSLRRGSVAFAGTAGSAVGIQAPSAGVSFLPALMAGIVGGAGPSAFGAAVIVMLFVAYAFVVFTREFASAGSVYAFNSTAAGPAYGLVSVWLLLFTYLAYAAPVPVRRRRDHRGRGGHRRRTPPGDPRPAPLSEPV